MDRKGRRKVIRGEDQGTAVLNEFGVRLIRILAANDVMTPSGIARWTGVGRATVYRVISRTHWRHIA